MYLLRVLCVVLSCAVACIIADCPYEAEVTKMEPCDKKQPDLFSIPKPYSIKMVSDACNIAVSGCVVLHQDVKTVMVKWVAWHNKNQVHKGEKAACGYKMGNLDVKCPLKKGTKLCAKSEEVKNPVGAMGLGMFLGNMKIKFEATSESGVTQCMMGEGVLRKKK